LSVVDQYTPAIISGLIAFIGAFIMLLVARGFGFLDKSRQSSTSNTLNISLVQEDVREIKKEASESRKHVDAKMNDLDHTLRTEFKRQAERFEEVVVRLTKTESEIEHHEYRLDRIEKHNGVKRE
jgi:uncharacterized membrane protein YhiD involved in acid resistance